MTTGAPQHLVPGIPHVAFVVSTKTLAVLQFLLVRRISLRQPAHSVVSEVNMTSSVVLGRDRDRGVDELLAQLKAFTYRWGLKICCAAPVFRFCLTLHYCVVILRRGFNSYLVYTLGQ